MIEFRWIRTLIYFERPMASTTLQIKGYPSITDLRRSSGFKDESKRLKPGEQSSVKLL